jgi:Protein of unknown function (DUF1161)
MFKTLALLALLWGSLAQATPADPCEPLRARIESQVAARGITRFSVTVVEASAPVAGKVVGSCAEGQRKVVLRRGAANDDGAGATALSLPAQLASVARIRKPAPARAPGADIITECRDGTVIQGHASCKP